MNIFNKTEAVVFSCRLCCLRAFPIIGLIHHSFILKQRTRSSTIVFCVNLYPPKCKYYLLLFLQKSIFHITWRCYIYIQLKSLFDRWVAFWLSQFIWQIEKNVASAFTNVTLKYKRQLTEGKIKGLKVLKGRP